MYQTHKGHQDGSNWCIPGCPVWEAAKKKEQLEEFFLRQEIEEMFDKCLTNRPQAQREAWEKFKQENPNKLP